MNEPRRLHPISACMKFITQLKDIIIPFFIFLFMGNKADNSYIILIGTVIFLLINIGSSFLSWLFFTYRIEENELRIEQGVLMKKKRYIPFEKVQSLDVSEGIFHRPFGLVKMKIETAGGALPTEGAEAVFTAITKTEANRIQAAFTAAKKAETIPEDVVQEEKKRNHLYKMNLPELFLLSLTSGGAGVVISAVVAFVFQFDEILPYDSIFNGFESFLKNGVLFITIAIFLLFLFAWLIAFVGTMLKYANFTVVIDEKDLIISRGLIEKRQFTIPLKRIQAIRITENLIRQPLGFASVFVESAGGSEKETESAQALVIPIMKKKKIPALLANAFADFSFEGTAKPAPKRALRRYVFRNTFLWIPLSILACILFQPWGYFSILFVILSFIWGCFEYKEAGWCLTGSQLMLQYRAIVKQTVFLKKNKIQSLSLQETCFQKRKGLATIRAVADSGAGSTGGKVIDLAAEDVYAIYKWYSKERNNH
ncbi:PH domain-containing protein [Bacillaceae bacterium Marseille-Q3522]|nr:PH domain-containing protein [Bacillaceae bacterium Marseille-Q3522]